MGITSVSCSLNLIWIVHSKTIDVQQLFIKFLGAPCQVQIWKTLRGMEMGSECGTRGGGVQQYRESPRSQVITRVLQGTQNCSRNPLICTAALVEDMGTGSNPRQRHSVAEL